MLHFFKLSYILIIWVNVGAGDVELVVRTVGDYKSLQLFAQEIGYYVKGPVLGFMHTYSLLPLPDIYLSHGKRNIQISKKLDEDPEILWIGAQYAIQRQKRDDFYGNIKPPEYKFNSIDYYDSIFNDELWTAEWYLRNTRSHSNLDLNVLAVYEAGITGKNVKIAILDDGVEYTHDDLKKNYDPTISYDCNEEDYDPLPRYDAKRVNSHGTRCAGEIAMVADNKKCGVGIAYNAKIGGVKMLDGLVTDKVEGTALAYAHQLVDIYSISWGPNDDGKTVEGPGQLAKEAIEMGIKKGREGKGSIYVWASGNGGSKNDNCNCDGYLTNPYTITIGSTTQKGKFPWYGEECASILAVTYSSGTKNDQMIATTDLNNQCTLKHTGTSASAPLAAGIIALALEINPQLTWRDVQHLIVWTSEKLSLEDDGSWKKNAANFWFNPKFGFGLMNAYTFVKNAANWTRVPERHTCLVKDAKTKNNTLASGLTSTVYFYSDACMNGYNVVNYLEHVELQINLDYTVRGALEIYLTSPSGSKVQILKTRKNDQSVQGFKDWSFMSVMTWGENPQGIWTVTLTDKVGPPYNKGYINEMILILHGTKELPNHMRDGPRKYRRNLHETY